jgi:hypothetical protein
MLRGYVEMEKAGGLLIGVLCWGEDFWREIVLLILLLLLLGDIMGYVGR